MLPIKVPEELTDAERDQVAALDVEIDDLVAQVRALSERVQKLRRKRRFIKQRATARNPVTKLRRKCREAGVDCPI
jgi:phage shock protein A